MNQTANASDHHTSRIARPRWVATVIRHPSAILLLVQLAGLLLYPFIEQTHSARALFGAFGVVVLLLTIAMVQRTRDPIVPGRDFYRCRVQGGN